MFKHYFEQIYQVEIWPIISLCIFFVFFVVVTIRVFTLDKNHIRKMKSMPFDNGDIVDSNNGSDDLNS